jgi:ferredoxin
MAKVFVEPIGITIEVPEAETLFKPLVNAAVAIPTDCGGRGTCGKCLVRLGAGELSPPSAAELKLIPAEREWFNRRLHAGGGKFASWRKPMKRGVGG